MELLQVYSVDIESNRIRELLSCRDGTNITEAYLGVLTQLRELRIRINTLKTETQMCTTRPCDM